MPLVLLLVVTMVVQGLWLLRFQRRGSALDGRLAATVLQTFAGIN